MEVREHRIDEIEQGSIAYQLGIEAGDYLLAINGTEIGDALDYHFLISDTNLVLTVKKADGSDWEYEIEKDYYEDLGLIFANGLMDEYRSCCNHCIFCFIDQMPPNMRKTLYFKDDDSRLSFLQGNYITLTNMSDKDLNRIIQYHLSPINISVHTTNPQLRIKMLRNRKAGEALDKIRRLYEGKIEMNAQIVLCKGINDGAELERSIRELSEFMPYMQSLSVVPAGLTRYRKGLYPLEKFTRDDAKNVIETVHKWQEKCYNKYTMHFVHASDEWYLMAEEDFPPEESYDGYVQLENGVGMMRLLQTEFEEALANADTEDPAPAKTAFFQMLRWNKKNAESASAKRSHVVSVATGRLAAPMIRKLSLEFMLTHTHIQVRVYEIENRFFGTDITVSGLLTGQDLRDQLLGQDLGERLLLPVNMLRSGQEVFLDDMTLQELEDALSVPIRIVDSDGASLYNELRMTQP